MTRCFFWTMFLFLYSHFASHSFILQRKQVEQIKVMEGEIIHALKREGEREEERKRRPTETKIEEKNTTRFQTNFKG